MFLNIPLVADTLTLARHRQALIYKRLLRANRTRSSHEFEVGQQFWNIRNRTEKLELTHTGPWNFIQVHKTKTKKCKSFTKRRMIPCLSKFEGPNPNRNRQVGRTSIALWQGWTGEVGILETQVRANANYFLHSFILKFLLIYAGFENEQLSGGCC
jgi:hypothetical protein